VIAAGAATLIALQFRPSLAFGTPADGTGGAAQTAAKPTIVSDIFIGLYWQHYG